LNGLTACSWSIFHLPAPQEHIWERARDTISHSPTYPHFEPLIEDFETYLNETLFSANFMDAFTPLGSVVS